MMQKTIFKITNKQLLSLASIITVMLYLGCASSGQQASQAGETEAEFTNANNTELSTEQTATNESTDSEFASENIEFENTATANEATNEFAANNLELNDTNASNEHTGNEGFDEELANNNFMVNNNFDTNFESDVDSNLVSNNTGNEIAGNSLENQTTNNTFTNNDITFTNNFGSNPAANTGNIFNNTPLPENVPVAESGVTQAQPSTQPSPVIPHSTLWWVGYNFSTTSPKLKIEMVTRGHPDFDIYEETNKSEQPELVVRFYKTKLRSKIRYDIDASEFASPVGYVRMRENRFDGYVDVVLTLRERIRPLLNAKNGNVLLTYNIPKKYFGNQSAGTPAIAAAEVVSESASILPEAANNSELPLALRSDRVIPDPTGGVFGELPEDGATDLATVSLSEPGGSNLPANGEPAEDSSVFNDGFNLDSGAGSENTKNDFYQQEEELGDYLEFEPSDDGFDQGSNKVIRDQPNAIEVISQSQLIFVLVTAIILGLRLFLWRDV